MAIKFEDDVGGEGAAKKAINGNAYAAKRPSSEPENALPFAKPVKAGKKVGKPER